MMQQANKGSYRKVWVVALLIAVLPFAYAKAQEGCATYQLDAEVEICSEIKDRAKVGKTILWTISVPSTDKPTALRLRNATPMVAKLRRGCADGIVRTSGGTRNRARCKVKIIGLGTARLEAWPHLEDSQQRADLTASRIVGDLARCERDFQTQRESLKATQHNHFGRGVYSSGDVEAVLIQGEKCALSALGGLLELVAMADWFDKIFEDARNELRSISTRASLPSDDGSPVVLSVLKPETVRSPAVLAHAGEVHLDADKTNGILVTLYESLGLARRKAAEKKLLIPGLCVRSAPAGARFKIYPRSYSAGVHVTTTDGLVENLSPGIYAYKLEKGKMSKGCTPDKEDHYSCDPINLMRGDQVTLECDFDYGCHRNNSRTLENCRNGQ